MGYRTYFFVSIIFFLKNACNNNCWPLFILYEYVINVQTVCVHFVVQEKKLYPCTEYQMSFRSNIGLATLITVTSNHHHQCHGRSCLLLIRSYICFNFDTAEKKYVEINQNASCILFAMYKQKMHLSTSTLNGNRKKCRTEKSVSIRNSCLDLVFFFTILSVTG